LGASGTNLDIGALFPDDDPQYKDADSAVLLAEARKHVLGRIGNVDAMVLAERPKLSPYRDAMRARIAEILEIDVADVGMKFTTMEGLGAIGEGKAIACQAVATIERSSGERSGERSAGE